MSKRYHHIGLPAADQETPIEGETYIESSDMWISSPDDHPQRIEWLRYGPKNTTPDSFRNAPHLCYEVDDLRGFLESIGSDATPRPMGEPPFADVVFLDDGSGIEIEYIQVYPGRHWFDDKAKGLI
jgi:hypothetical protein